MKDPEGAMDHEDTKVAMVSLPDIGEGPPSHLDKTWKPGRITLIFITKFEHFFNLVFQMFEEKSTIIYTYHL